MQHATFGTADATTLKSELTWYSSKSHRIAQLSLPFLILRVASIFFDFYPKLSSCITSYFLSFIVMFCYVLIHIAFIDAFFVTLDAAIDAAVNSGTVN